MTDTRYRKRGLSKAGEHRSSCQNLPSSARLGGGCMRSAAGGAAAPVVSVRVVVAVWWLRTVGSQRSASGALITNPDEVVSPCFPARITAAFVVAVAVYGSAPRARAPP